MSHTITEIEEKWLTKLFEYNRNRFSLLDLPSHDHLHHLRVWHFVKDLLTELEKEGIAVPYEIQEKLIFASFFHDIGLSETLQEDHGKVSSDICREYLRSNNISFRGGSEDLLRAIEYHDDKSYKQDIANDNPADLYTLLTVCDDLDAFGAIGVFRYLEIYLLRNIVLKELPGKVLLNIQSRYDKLHSHYSFLKNFMSKHTGRYEYTRDFYYNLSLCINNDGKHTCKDYYTVEAVNLLIENYVSGKLDREKLKIAKPGSSESTGKNKFMDKFREELSISESGLL
jgi:HD superfamily phosphodiesterase